MASLTMKSAITGTPIVGQKSFIKPVATRGLNVVRASSEDMSRRAAIFGSFASSALLLSGRAMAIDIVDRRRINKEEYNLIYEARDVDLPQNVRDGLDQYRGSIDATRKRLNVSIDRLKTKLPSLIEREYWTPAREELRLQLGTLRFDLDTVAAAKGDKASKRAALRAADDFLAEVEVLDSAIRSKDKDKATKAFEVAISALQGVTVG